MKESPVQLVDVFPLRISISLNGKYTESDEGGDEFQLEHMARVARAGKSESGEQFFLSLGIRSVEDAGKAVPYFFEILVAGRVEVRSTPANVGPEDIATRNGLTMLYGQVRELLISNTARMQHGKFLLPTMSFMDCSFADISKPTEQTPEDARG